MKFTLSWLADHLDTQASLTEIADTLTDCGLEVEEITDKSAAFANFTVCRVVDAQQHPDADRLRVCLVEIWPSGAGGATKQVQVVCGAPNARKGLVGIFAPVGSVIPSNGMLLKRTRIRGVESNGMLCSERELKISDEHDGIIDLPVDTELGAPFAEVFGLNDPMIEIAVTPNRPDALGVRGIARDLAARGLGKLRPMTIDPVVGKFACPVSISIDSDAKQRSCPAFFGRVVRNVKNGKSPDWMQRRLASIGLRPISALVDITNYITYDLNRPLHAFDADKVGPELRIHLAKGGEKIVALDNATHELSRGQVVISDNRGPESIAGVMGGLATGCSDETVNVFLESALWDPIQTAATGRKLKINSDARFRFERGVDPEFVLLGLEAATKLVLDICGGEASHVACDGAIPNTKREYFLRKDRVWQLAGLSVDAEKQQTILSNLGFTVVPSEDRFLVKPPSWRPDIQGEADLVEEIARIASLTRLKGKPLPPVDPGVAKQILLPAQKREQICRRTIASLGYNECVSYSFVNSSDAESFLDGDGSVEIDNPISSDLDVMRPDLLPNLLKAAVSNQSRGFGDLAFFEVGPVFNGTDAGAESLHATGLLVGCRAPRSPHLFLRQVDLYDAKADAEAVLSAIFPSAEFKLSRDVPTWMHPGRSGSLYLQPGKPLAIFGEINPKLARKIGLRNVAVAFTLYLDSLPTRRSKGKTRPTFVPKSLQHVDRDFAFVLSCDVEASTVVAAVQRSRFRKLFSEVRVFDEYFGPQAEKQLGERRKSLAITVRLQPEEVALKDSELDAICADIARAVQESVGGQLRS